MLFLPFTNGEIPLAETCWSGLKPPAYDPPRSKLLPTGNSHENQETGLDLAGQASMGTGLRETSGKPDVWSHGAGMKVAMEDFRIPCMCS